MQLWVYKHYKNKLYEVIWVAFHTETEEKMVLYKALYDNPNLAKEYWMRPYFVRPYDMFIENIVINWIEIPRFEYVWNKKYGEM